MTSIPENIRNFYSKYYGITWKKDAASGVVGPNAEGKKIDTDGSNDVSAEELQVHIFQRLEQDAATNPALKNISKEEILMVKEAAEQWRCEDRSLNMEDPVIKKEVALKTVPEDGWRSICRSLNIKEPGKATWGDLKTALDKVFLAFKKKYPELKLPDGEGKYTFIARLLLNQCKNGAVRFDSPYMKGASEAMVRNLYGVVSRLESGQVDAAAKVSDTWCMSPSVQEMKTALGITGDSISLKDFISALKKCDASALQKAEYVRIFLTECVGLRSGIIYEPKDNYGGSVRDPYAVLKDSSKKANCMELALLGMAVLRSAGVKVMLIESGNTSDKGGSSLHISLLIGEKNNPSAVGMLDLFTNKTMDFKKDDNKIVNKKNGECVLRQTVVAYAFFNVQKDGIFDKLTKKENIGRLQALTEADKALRAVKIAYDTYLAADSGSKAKARLQLNAAVNAALKVLAESDTQLNVYSYLTDMIAAYTKMLNAILSAKDDELSSVRFSSKGKTLMDRDESVSMAATAEEEQAIINVDEALVAARKAYMQYISVGKNAEAFRGIIEQALDVLKANEAHLPKGSLIGKKLPGYIQQLEALLKAEGKVAVKGIAFSPTIHAASWVGGEQMEIIDTASLGTATSYLVPGSDFFSTGSDAEMVFYNQAGTQFNWQRLPKSALYFGKVQALHFTAVGAANTDYDLYAVVNGSYIKISEGRSYDNSSANDVKFLLAFNDINVTLAEGFAVVPHGSLDPKNDPLKEYIVLSASFQQSYSSVKVAVWNDQFHNNDGIVYDPPVGTSGTHMLAIGTKTVNGVAVPWINPVYRSAGGADFEGGYSITITAGTNACLGDDTYKAALANSNKVKTLVIGPSGYVDISDPVDYQPGNFVLSNTAPGVSAIKRDATFTVRMEGVSGKTIYGKFSGQTDSLYVPSTSTGENYSFTIPRYGNSDLDYKQFGDPSTYTVAPIFKIDSLTGTAGTLVDDDSLHAVVGAIYMPPQWGGDSTTGSIENDQGGLYNKTTNKNLELQDGYSSTESETVASASGKYKNADFQTSTGKIHLRSKVPSWGRDKGLRLCYKVDGGATQYALPSGDCDMSGTFKNQGADNQYYLMPEHSYQFEVSGLAVQDGHHTIQYWLEDPSGVNNPSVVQQVTVYSYDGSGFVTTVCGSSNQDAMDNPRGAVGTSMINPDDLNETYVQIVVPADVVSLDLYSDPTQIWRTPQWHNAFMNSDYKIASEEIAACLINSAAVDTKGLSNLSDYKMTTPRNINGVLYKVYMIPAKDIFPNPRKGAYTGYVTLSNGAVVPVQLQVGKFNLR